VKSKIKPVEPQDEHREPAWVTLNPDGSVFRWNDGTPILHHSEEEAARYLSPGGRVTRAEVFISFAENHE
jgi:hypothetical protein